MSASSVDREPSSRHASSAHDARLPTFLVIGAMKAGTTSLYHYLRSHPQVFMPDEKEPMFFDARHNWKRGVQWYRGLFAGATERHVALGEASTSYTKFPVVRDVPSRVAAVLPDARLIYVLRHPVDRMRSHYLYALSRGRERRPIERAFDADRSYVDISRYAMQIEQYLPHVPLERFLFLDSRDLAERRVETLRRVYAFIGVDETWVPPIVEREFFRSSERRMKPALAERMRRVPPLASLVDHAPRSVRRIARRRLPAERVDVERARISEELRERLEAALRDDVARLYRYLPEGFDGWGLA